MAMMTMAQLSSVGVTRDHIVRTSGPSSLQYEISFIIAFAWVSCPLNAESRLNHSQQVVRVHSQLIGWCRVVGG